MSLLILAVAGFAFSEDQTADSNALPVSAPVATAAVPQDNSDSVNTQWVWGEVTNVDAQNKSFGLKYLDYETDQEKEMTINTDYSTNYDNAKALDEIQPKDNVSVDYIVKDGKNIAKAIGLERAENTATQEKVETGASVTDIAQPAAVTATAPQAEAANIPEATSASAETPKTDAQASQSNQ